MSRLAPPYRTDVIEPKGQNGQQPLVPHRFPPHPARVPDPNPPQSLPPTPIRWGRIALLLGVIALGALGLSYALAWVQDTVGGITESEAASGLSAMMIGALILYALLIATPFMPGIEVGVALLMIKGAQIAPLVYLATVAGLMLAYLIGRLVPLSSLHWLFNGLGLHKACALITTMQETPAQDRLAHQRARLPKWLGLMTTDYRYLSIGLLLNVPGTFAIGGGGGILLAAGLSRLFNGWVILLTLMIATLPVPLTVWIMGTQVMP